MHITPELINAFDVSGPRYTSYPTADRFIEAYGVNDYVRALAQRRTGISRNTVPLSVYVHIPFCESLCYYCACNKIVTKHHDRAAQYLQYLDRELTLTTAQLGLKQAVSQLHLGGGTPTFLDDAQLRALMDLLKQHFDLQPQGEYSIEIDPRTVTKARLAFLATLGFNRLSFGVQDFDPAVQKAVHRIQPYDQVAALMQDARDLGFESLNVDLIYGLPLQTQESFAKTLQQVLSLRPDRIALYGYAHLPDRFKPQRRIDGTQIPLGTVKVNMLGQALNTFVQAGYDYVGMDHFALPTDTLAIAKRQGRLHRNFQGYSTQPDCDMISLGVSAIGKVGATYSQNAKTLEEYYDALDQGTLPIVKGIALNHDDVLRRAVIMALMCQGRLDFEAVNLAFLIDMRSYFAKELERLATEHMQDLVKVTDHAIEVTELGWYFIRGIAMVFDKYLQTDRTRATFSKIL